MLLIHLSDIHLKESDFNSEMDRNQNLRRKLIEDATKVCSSIGKKPSAIIVSGDIAYSAKPKEYEFADTWLNELCQKTGADFKDVFVIPGNHDVDRGAIKGTVPVAVQSRLRQLVEPKLENQIREYIEDEGSSAILLSPLAKYNEFSKKFGCDLVAGRNTLVKRIISLNDNFNVVIWGLNSVLVSNNQDSKNPGNMILAPSYHSIFQDEGTINIVTCHHPFNWIVNGEYFRSQVETNAHLLLFGHEHNNRFIQARNYLQISSSAVIPDEDGSGNLPGYNIIDMNISEENGKDYLIINLCLREWQFNPDSFREKVGMDGESIITSKFEVKKKLTLSNSQENDFSQMDIKDSGLILNKNDLMQSLGDEGKISSLNNLYGPNINAFLNLELSNKKKAALECQLWDDKYINLTSHDLTIEIIKAAIEKNKLTELLHLSNSKGS